MVDDKIISAKEYIESEKLIVDKDQMKQVYTNLTSVWVIQLKNYH